MHVAINALCITNRSGTGRYAFGLIDGLLQLNAIGHTFSVFLPSDFPLPKSWQCSNHIRFYRIPIRNAIPRIYWEQNKLPRLVQTIGAGLLHSPAFTAPAFGKVPFLQVVTVHDLAYIKHPGTMTWPRRALLQRIVRESIEKADTIITDSCVMRDEIQERYPEKKRVLPIHLAVDTNRFSPGVLGDETRILESYGLPEQYLLFVGTIEPRKNLATVLRAFQMAQDRGLQAKLVIVGRMGWKQSERQFRISNVLRIGFLDEEHLPVLYRNARVLLAPSIYEGFDLPPAEALACGTSVIASDIPVHREVLQQSVRLVSPTDADAWANALLDAECSIRPNSAVFPRAWRLPAEETLQVYEDTLSKR